MSDKVWALVPVLLDISYESPGKTRVTDYEFPSWDELESYKDISSFVSRDSALMFLAQAVKAKPVRLPIGSKFKNAQDKECVKTNTFFCEKNKQHYSAIVIETGLPQELPDNF